MHTEEGGAVPPTRGHSPRSTAMPLPSARAKGHRLRVALVADGALTDERTNSGVAYGMLQALIAHPSIEEVVPVDARLRRGWKALVGLWAVLNLPSRWRMRYSQCPFSVWVRSRIARRQIERLDRSVDVVIVLRGIYKPFPVPYVMFIDSTVRLTQAGWPALALGQGEGASSVRADAAQLQAAAHVYTAGQHVAENVILDYQVSEAQVTAIGGGLNYPIHEIPQRAPSPVPTILFVGHDFERKGGDLLVDAFARVRQVVPEARLLLVGRGARLHESHPGVTALGEIADRAELSRLYQQATVFCLPARFEPYGLVLLEAMAHGVPCIGTRVNEIPSLLQQGRLGLLVDPDDVEGLAEALTYILFDPQLQQEFSEAGRQFVEAQGTWTDVVNRMMSTLQLAAEQTSPSRQAAYGHRRQASR